MKYPILHFSNGSSITMIDNLESFQRALLDGIDSIRSFIDQEKKRGMQAAENLIVEIRKECHQTWAPNLSNVMT